LADATWEAPGADGQSSHSDSDVRNPVLGEHVVIMRDVSWYTTTR
jgi:hypothetical protein